MLDQSNHLSSRNPANQIHKNHGSREDIGFDFCGTRETQHYQNFRDRGRSEIEFQAQVEEDFDDDDSPRLWETNMSRNVRTESSPLLPLGYHYSNISPTPRLQAIAEGRRELMQMVHRMPESSYELSLKDIVDKQHVSQGEQEEKVIQETSFDFNAEAEIKKLKRKKTKSIIKAGQISRSGSMEKETVLIKMFIPTSFSWKTKRKAGTGSKVSPRTSFDGSENHVDKEWWVKRILVAGEGKNSGRSSSSGSSSSSSNSSSSRLCRHGKTNSFLGCWPFFCTTKSKNRRDQGCFF